MEYHEGSIRAGEIEKVKMKGRIAGHHEIHWKSKYQHRCGVNGTFAYYSFGYKVEHSFFKVVWQFLIHLPYNPVISLLGTYPREMTTYVHKKAYIRILPATFFNILKSLKQPKCLSAKIRQTINIYIMEYYFTIKNKLLIDTMTWLNLTMTWLNHVKEDS